MIDFIVTTMAIVTYLFIGVGIGRDNLKRKEYWEFTKTVPLRDMVTDDQVRFATMLMCALIWPIFWVQAMIRKIKK